MSEQLTASWAAVVSKSEGLSLEPGTPCDIHATFKILAGTLEFLELQVQCAGLPLYRLSDELNGLSMTSATLGVKEDDETGVSQYWLKFDDVGSRTGARNQVTIDTPSKTASIWKETAPKFQVDLAVEKWTGTPVQTDAGDASPGD